MKSNKMRVCSVEVTLYFELPEEYAGQGDANACDGANETLRALQRRFCPLSDLLDYEVGATQEMIVEIDPEIGYQEGDVSHAVEVED